jgi:hypothetical protein
MRRCAAFLLHARVSSLRGDSRSSSLFRRRSAADALSLFRLRQRALFPCAITPVFRIVAKGCRHVTLLRDKFQGDEPG